ncbi:MAG: hypothetical protein ABFS56_32535 [Pseudomonadota bacterium]
MKSHKSLKQFCVVGELMSGARVVVISVDSGITGDRGWRGFGDLFARFVVSLCHLADVVIYGGELLVRVCGGWVGVCV